MNGAGNATRASSVRHSVRLVDGDSLSYRQTDTDPDGHWRLVTTYVASRSVPPSASRCASPRSTADAYHLYVLYEPTLSNTPANDAGHTRGTTLVASDRDAASALQQRPRVHRDLERLPRDERRLDRSRRATAA